MEARPLRSPAHRVPGLVVPAISACSRPWIVLLNTDNARRSGILPNFRGLRAAVRQGKMRSATATGTMKANCRSTVVCETQEATIEDVTKATWRTLVLECAKPVVVEFWASWCEPCRMFCPVISKLSASFQENVRFFRLNTDENPEIASQYGIRSIPTVVIFRNGEKMERIIGSVSESMLLTFIQDYIDE